MVARTCGSKTLSKRSQIARWSFGGASGAVDVREHEAVGALIHVSGVSLHSPECPGEPRPACPRMFHMSVSPSSSLLLEDNHGKGQDIVVIHLASLHQAILPARVSSGVSLQKRRPKSTGRSQQHFVRLFFTKLLQKLLAVLGSIEVPLVLGAKVETKLLGLSPACPRAPNT